MRFRRDCFHWRCAASAPHRTRIRAVRSPPGCPRTVFPQTHRSARDEASWSATPRKSNCETLSCGGRALKRRRNMTELHCTRVTGSCPSSGSPRISIRVSPPSPSRGEGFSGLYRNQQKTSISPLREGVRAACSRAREGSSACHRERMAALFGEGALHLLLQLLEGAHLDLPHALAADAIFLRELFQRRRLVLEPSVFDDV